MKLLFVLLTAGLGTIVASTIQVDLLSSSETGAPGETLQFFGTITNLSATDTVFFNGASSSSVSGDLTIDVTPFLLNAPLFLGPAEGSGLFDVFDITIAPGAVAGPYFGNTVTLLGGTASNTFDSLLDINAGVTVANSTTPEPSSAALLLAGLGLIVGVRGRGRGRVRKNCNSPL